MVVLFPDFGKIFKCRWKKKLENVMKRSKNRKELKKIFCCGSYLKFHYDGMAYVKKKLTFVKRSKSFIILIWLQDIMLSWGHFCNYAYPNTALKKYLFLKCVFAGFAHKALFYFT